MKTIFVGNLPFSATEEQVRDIFATRAVVHTVTLFSDRETDRFRSYGYVDVDDEALETVLKLDGKGVDGRPMRVNEAKTKSGEDGNS